ncbi:dihydropteroate synthase-like protein [Candidatus Methanoliparum sp. LAM-1]|nr:dihydropteroate synthase-like protein [Candidatus Methanoliparum sp. LAM-1]
MRILIITGKKSERIVKEIVEECAKDYADVLVCNRNIAAFITPTILKKTLKEQDIDLKLYGLILIPGLITADFTKLEDEIKVPIRLGPKNAYDLRYILPEANKIKFSSKIPACELLSHLKVENAKKDVIRLEKDADYLFKLKGLKLGKSSRMKVLSEIVDADKYDTDDLVQKIKYYLSEGTDMIDLGISLDADIDDVEKILDTISGFKVPFSIDTSIPEFLVLGSNKADMLLSANKDVLDRIGKKLADTDSAVVIIPDDDKLDDNIDLAKSIGIKKIIADPVLDPINMGLFKSLIRYREINLRYKEIPLFFGIGNVSELIDTDSTGANAILAGIGAELGVSILFTPEYSRKCFGSIYELKKISEMMFLAKNRKMPPKDLGIDLILFKEKRIREFIADISDNIIIAKENKTWHIDPLGGFSIRLKDGKIYATHKDATIVGKTAKSVLDTIISEKMVSLKEHVAYLGRELMKAEICLKMCRSYIQDEEFRYVYPFLNEV